MEGIEHHTMKIATLGPNGFVGRMNRTLLDEYFPVAGRQTWHITPAKIQRDPGAFPHHYNLERSHEGYRLKGRTPAQALRRALAIEPLPPDMPEPEVTAENEPDTLAAQSPLSRPERRAITKLVQPGAVSGEFSRICAGFRRGFTAQAILRQAINVLTALDSKLSCPGVRRQSVIAMNWTRFGMRQNGFFNTTRRN